MKRSLLFLGTVLCLSSCITLSSKNENAFSTAANVEDAKTNAIGDRKSVV